MEDITNYKGFTIEKFVVEWSCGKEKWTNISYIINSPYYLQSTPQKPKSYLPLFAENKKGQVVEFKTLKSAKSYITKYMVKKLGKVIIKNGDEAHFQLD